MRYITASISLVSICVLLAACSEDKPHAKPSEDQGIRMLALDISGQTEANVLFMCTDGSYALLDAENESGYMTLHIAPSCTQDIHDGITVLLTSEGIPVAAASKNETVIFANFRERLCDAVLISSDGTPHYMWDLPLLPQPASILTAPERKEIDWTALGYFAFLKGVSFGITGCAVAFATAGVTLSSPAWVIAGGVIAIVSLGYTMYSEAVKSGRLKEPSWLKFTDKINDALPFFDFIDKETKKIVFKVGRDYMGIPEVAGGILNSLGDLCLERYGSHQEEIEGLQLDDSYRIKLSTYLLECSPEEGRYSVGIDTNAYWSVDAAGVPAWCSVEKGEGAISVSVERNETAETRSCSVVIRSLNEAEIPSVTLRIVQDGLLFNLHPTELVFNAEGDDKAVAVETNEIVKSWRVTACPNWCSIQPGKTSFFVRAERNKTNEMRSGLITVTAFTASSMPVDRTVQVSQPAPAAWDGTKWHFDGTLDAVGIQSYEFAFGIDIKSISQGDFTMSGGMEGMEHHSTIACDAMGRLVIETKFRESDKTFTIDVQAKTVTERTGVETAACTISGHVSSKLEEFEDISYELSGSCNGTMVNAAHAVAGMSCDKADGFALWLRKMASEPAFRAGSSELR